MTSPEQRHNLMSLIEQARADGATLRGACAQVGLTARSFQRWRQPAESPGDQRVSGKRRYVGPANKLSEPEQQAVLEVLNSDEYKDLPPSQVVPRLADQQVYLACESTMYRLLRESGQLKHRRAERPPQKRTKPRALKATLPDQVYCWDITYLPTEVRGQHFYLYLFEDLFSRKIVGWQVFGRESAEQASELLLDICERQGIAPNQLTVHSDNGSPMKGATMLSTMQRLGVAHTRSRPSVSNDNPYVEAIFRTLKYRPELPVKPFESLLTARRWAAEMAHWYNDEHRHSGIGFVTPTQRHAGQDQDMLKQRAQVYATARQNHPERWSKEARQWAYVNTVHLNPDTPESEKAQPLQKAA